MEMKAYNEMLDLINSMDDLDGMMLESLSDNDKIKVFDENGESTYSYAQFIDMFDKGGLEAFCK